MHNKKSILVYAFLISVSLIIFFFGFIEKIIFLISFVSVFFGSLSSEFRFIGISKENPKISILFSVIIILISMIAVYYTVFVEIFAGAIVGFFLAKVFKSLKGFLFK